MHRSNAPALFTVLFSCHITSFFGNCYTYAVS